MATIDESYCGDADEWKMPVLAMRDTHIKKGDRICQFRIVKKMPDITFDEVESLGNADRGAGFDRQELRTGLWVNEARIYVVAL